MPDIKIPLLKIPCDAEGLFKARPNRFLGVVDIIHPQPASEVRVHVHDPGRLTQILYPGNRVLLRRAKAKTRKTGWDMIAGRYEKHWVLVHSGFHRQLAEQIIQDVRISPFGKVIDVKPEVTYGHSRLDFLIKKDNGKDIWLEVKGCTLAENGVALFPDAPTQRGRKHLNSLISLKQGGSHAAILILVFVPDATCFAPHKEIDPEFSATFYKALEAGVEVYPVVLGYRDGLIYFEREIDVCK